MISRNPGFFVLAISFERETGIEPATLIRQMPDEALPLSYSRMASFEDDHKFNESWRFWQIKFFLKKESCFLLFNAERQPIGFI